VRRSLAPAARKFLGEKASVKNMFSPDRKMHAVAGIAAMLALGSSSLSAQATSTTTPPATPASDCSSLPSYTALKTALTTAQQQKNSGLGFNMWATIVNRDGYVCAVAFTGNTRGDQWPGSRVISAQKANTANAFSVPLFALSTANLYAATQNGGTLFGLQFSNPVDNTVAYAGDATQYGQVADPLVGKQIGGVNVFGGGLALYTTNVRKLVGGLGVSGDTSCTDHIIAWKVRGLLQLDNVPAGVAGAGGDNMINDLITAANGVTSSPSGFGHPSCDALATSITAGLPATNPLGQ
jgi:uncharacterized protein GlcG (DUF336 family)